MPSVVVPVKALDALAARIPPPPPTLCARSPGDCTPFVEMFTVLVTLTAPPRPPGPPEAPSVAAMVADGPVDVVTEVARPPPPPTD